MGERTGISWTDSTWNPWIGCRKVSPGCKNCYAERWVEDRMDRRFTEVIRARNSTFIAPLKWKPLKERTWPGFPTRRVFTCSISDFFIEEADAWRDQAWGIIRATPHHIYQILTKRPERIADHLPKVCFRCGQNFGHSEDTHEFEDWPWPNVWLGTSVEDQKYAELRIPRLVAVPAKVHFLSCEPLLGPIEFHLGPFSIECDECGIVAMGLTTEETFRLADKHNATVHKLPPITWGPELGHPNLLDDIEWVIVGGESGPGFRPMNPDWARSIRDDCLAAEVPFFFKQSSGLRSEMNPVLDGREWREMPR